MALIRRSNRFKRERRGSQLVIGTSVKESSKKEIVTREQKLIDAALHNRQALKKRQSKEKG